GRGGRRAWPGLGTTGAGPRGTGALGAAVAVPPPRPPPPHALSATARAASPIALDQLIGLQERPGDLGRLALVDVHRRIHPPHGLGRQLRADRVERLGERGALRLEHLLADNRRDVLEAEDELRVREHDVLAPLQLAV